LLAGRFTTLCIDMSSPHLNPLHMSSANLLTKAPRSTISISLITVDGETHVVRMEIEQFLGVSRSNTRMWQTQERLLLPHVLSYLDIKVNKTFGLAEKSVVTPLFLKCGSALLDVRQDSRLGQLIQDTFLELGQNPRELSEEFLPLYDSTGRVFQASSCFTYYLCYKCWPRCMVPRSICRVSAMLYK
jgi:hypothetical protein